MQATNGLGVILENRYCGESYPFNTSTTDNLRYLTTEQSQWKAHVVRNLLTISSNCWQCILRSTCNISRSFRESDGTGNTLDSLWRKSSRWRDSIFNQNIWWCPVWRYCKQRTYEACSWISRVVKDFLSTYTGFDSKLLQVQPDPKVWAARLRCQHQCHRWKDRYFGGLWWWRSNHTTEDDFRSRVFDRHQGLCSNHFIFTGVLILV